MPPVRHSVWAAILLAAAVVAVAGSRRSPIVHGLRYMDCGGELNASRGYFHTPNFPSPFPVPISCRWVLHAPARKRIVVHFTQFYLREGVWATGYLYTKDHEHVGEQRVGDINVDRRPANFAANKPYLAIHLRLDQISNTNVRVRDSLLDVYGFNITYEIVDDQEPMRNACSVHNCSYNGNCYASADYRRYWCQCFPPFYGRSCQYGLDCDPERGRNRCRNGGTCSYAGSHFYFCHCPTNYKGENCEIKIEHYENKECEAMNCDHLCKQARPGIFYCACNLGFHLHRDNHTCISNGLTRYKIGIKLRNTTYVPESANRSSATYIQIKNSIERKLTKLLSGKVLHMKNLMVLQFRPGAVVEFHFFSNENQSKVAEDTLLNAKKLGMIDDLPIDTKYFNFEPEPALSIQSLKPDHPGGDVVLHKQLVLTCITLGSSAIQFSWFKDGSPLDLSKVGRNTWLNLMPKDLKDEYVAHLIIGSVQEAHTGLYTCRVSDWGEVQELSVSIRVLTRPRVTVSPMTLTVRRGESISILCMSRIDHSVKFGYNWAKNGEIIVPDDGSESIEDIHPDGSRVLIPSIIASATYTCMVHSIPGVKNVDVRITVIDPNAIQVCPAEVARNVQWGQAAPNTRDVQPCPARFLGNASRYCLRLDAMPFWSEPDFTNCRSHTLMALRSKFANLQIGFMVTTSSRILQDLFKHLKDRGSGIYPGEGSSFLELLSDVHLYEESNSIAEVQFLNGSDVYFDIVSHLLSTARAINSEGKVLQLIDEVQKRALYVGRYLPTGETLHIDKDALAVDIVRRPLAPRFDFAVPLRRIRHDHTEWFTDPIFATVDVDESRVATIDGNFSIEVAVIFYKNLSQLLPKRSSKRSSVHSHFMDMEYELNSKVVTVAYHVDGQQSTLAASEQGNIRVAFDQSSWEVERKGWNVSCGLANFSLGRLDWSLDGCSLVSLENVTSCLCTRFGTYVVLLTTHLSRNGEEFYSRLDSIVAIGCFVGAALTFLALISLAVCWRNFFHGFAILKMQICIGILGEMTTFLTTAQVALPKAVHPYVMTMIEFFLLEPLAMQVCLELLLYLELVNVRHIEHAITKITLLGWGIPTLVTGATLIVEAQNGFHNKGWWMQVGDTYFLGFTISSVILLGLYILLYLVVNLELRHKMSLESPQRLSAIKRMGLLHRSLVLQLASTAVAISSIVYSNSPVSLHRYAFATVCGLTGFLVFVLYTVKSESPGCICSKGKGEVIKSASGVSTRSITTSSLLKLEDSQADVVVNSKGSECNEWASKSRGPHCILRGQSREMEDLLHEMVTSDQNCRNQLVSSEKKNGTQETYLESLEEPDKAVLRQADCPLLLGRKASMPLSHMGIVDYEGSPKKYPSSRELCGDEWIMSVVPELIPRPERGVCFIRNSPDPSLTCGESPASSSNWSADGSTSCHLRVATPACKYQCPRVEPRAVDGLVEHLTEGSATSTTKMVPFGMEGLMRGCCGQEDGEESASESYSAKRLRSVRSGNYVNVPLDQRDTVV